jgi:peptide/nickel transport system substrate-binding protein
MKYTERAREDTKSKGLLPLGAVVILALVLAYARAPAQKPAVKPGPPPAPTAPTTRVALAPAAFAVTAAPAAEAAEELIAPDLAKVHPVIAQYHWSKLPTPTGKPKYGGTMHLDLRYDPSNWDPFTGNLGTYVWGNVVYNKLMQADIRLSTAFKTKGANLQQLFPVCDLCESWEQTSPTQYTFKIRPEAKWQNIPPLNGRKLTAQDIKFAYDKYLDPKAFQQWATFQMVESIGAPDESSLIINLKQPFPDFIDSITQPGFFVFPREAFEREGGLIVAPPLGSGPFLFVKHVKQNTLTFRRNPAYWKTDEFGQQLPYLDAIELVWVPDPATQQAAFRTGKIDGVFAFSWDEVETLLRTEKPGVTAHLRVSEMNTGGNTMWQFQLREPPFNDARVRRALAMALDRPAIIKRAVGRGYCPYGTVPTWWLARAFPYPCEEFGPWFQYNPSQAKAVLREAGYDATRPLTFDVHAWQRGGAMLPFLAGQVEAVLDYWRAIGVNANLKLMEFTAHQALLRSKAWKGIIAGTGVGPGTSLNSYVMKVHSQGPENYGGINDLELDKLVEAQQQEFDIEKRQAIAQQIRERELDQVYRLWISMYYFAEFTKPQVRNWVTHELYMFHHGWGTHSMEYTWFER